MAFHGGIPFIVYIIGVGTGFQFASDANVYSISSSLKQATCPNEVIPLFSLTMDNKKCFFLEIKPMMDYVFKQKYLFIETFKKTIWQGITL